MPSWLPYIIPIIDVMLTPQEAIPSQNGAERIFVVLNPTAGNCDAPTVRQTLVRICDPAGIGCDFYETAGEEDVAARVRQARTQGYRMIVAAGGDGTVSAVASGLVQSDLPLGILPVGTANLLARELKLPLTLQDACRLLINSRHIRAIDIMRAGDRVFISHVSLGVYSRIYQNTSALARRHFRPLAYFWNALKEIFGKHTWRFHLNIDGRPYHPRASLIMLANVGGIGAGALRWGPDIKPDDGEITVLILRARLLKDYLRLVWHIIRHQHHRSLHIRYLSARRNVEISTRKDLAVRGDGEIVGQSKITIQIIPKALQIIVPDDY